MAPSENCLREETVNASLTRRGFITTATAGVTAGAQKQARPNILWICTDQQRWDTIHSLGNPHIRTPNLDKLAASGVAFTRAHCQTPICTASRASFLTGRYPSSVHACMNGNAEWDNAAPLITRTLADAGYDCGLAGKLHLSAADGRIEKRPDDGYRVFHWSHHPADDWPEGHAYADWLTSRGVDYAKTHDKHGFIPTEFHQTTWCADRAIDFMNEQRTGPWLMSVNCFDPHPQFDPPQEYLDRFDVDSLPGPLFRETDLAAQRRLEKVNFQSRSRRPEQFNGKLTQAKYWAQIELIDDQVGRMLQSLADTGQLDRTVVIFTSDHGETCGDHGLLSKGCRFYESLVRVPLIISWPGHLKQGVRSEALVELTDITPTLLELAELPGDENMHGRSLVPILTGAAPAGRHRDFVRCEYYRALGGVQSFATMVRDDRYKLAVYHGHGLGELFDLREDPGEFDNLWDDPAHAGARFDLMQKSFDALALAVDVGPKRVGRY